MDCASPADPHAPLGQRPPALRRPRLAVRGRAPSLVQKLLLLLGLAAAFMLGAEALGHGGGLDAHGCHRDTSAEEYHCHQGPLDGQRFESKQQAIQSGDIQDPAGETAEGGAYDRDFYSHWIDEDGDCQDTRQEVLIAQGEDIRLSADGCRVISGVWIGPYTGERYTDPSDLHVDHVVPLREAHSSGGRNWDGDRREAFANSPGNLLVVGASANLEKGARSPDRWLPARGACEYVERWAAVKKSWDLRMDAAERRKIDSVRRACE